MAVEDNRTNELLDAAECLAIKIPRGVADAIQDRTRVQTMKQKIEVNATDRGCERDTGGIVNGSPVR